MVNFPLPMLPDELALALDLERAAARITALGYEHDAAYGVEWRRFRSWLQGTAQDLRLAVAVSS